MKKSDNQPSGVLSFDFAAGAFKPIEADGYFPIGAVVTYGDIKNHRKRYVVTGDTIAPGSTGQECLCEDGHPSHVTRTACNGPGGWQDTGEILKEFEIAKFTAEAAITRGRLQREETERQAAQQAQAEADRKRYRTQYAHLKQVGENEYSSAKHAAANIRIELKRAFPGVKFSVRSERFSGGDSVDVSWTLGPKDEAVQDITAKYQEGSFNGMEDIYEDNEDRTFTTMFGGAKYVQTHRAFDSDLEKDLAGLIADLNNIPRPADGQYWNVYQDGDHHGHSLQMLAMLCLSAQAYPAGAVVTGIKRRENVTSGHHEDFYEVTWRASEKTPRQPIGQPDKVTEPTASYNADKDGIEIRFPAKPAENIRASLKSNGFRWSKFGKCWYVKRKAHYLEPTKQIPCGIPVSDELRKLLTDKAEQDTKQPAPYDSVDAQYEDDCARACGLI